MKSKFIPVVFILIFLVSCQSAPPEPDLVVEAPPSDASADLPEPTQAPTEAPTDAPEPTEMPSLPTPTALPEGVIFRDDFEGELQPGWEWENENIQTWDLTDDGWLEIEGEALSLLGDGTQSNLLWRDLPGGDFVITVHLKANPSENFHQATIYIYEDPNNYIAFNRGFCDICETGGGGFFMEYKIEEINVAWGAYQKATEAEDVYLKLESVDKTISGYYATEEGQWERLGRFGNYFEFSRVGLGVTNINAESVVTGYFDYFEIAQP